MRNFRQRASLIAQKPYLFTRICRALIIAVILGNILFLFWRISLSTHPLFTPTESDPTTFWDTDEIVDGALFDHSQKSNGDTAAAVVHTHTHTHTDTDAKPVTKTKIVYDRSRGPISEYNQPIEDNSFDTDVTLQNRKLRRPYAKDCHRPVGFPGGPPGIKRLKLICANLKVFSADCGQGKSCQECIPPWGGDDWIMEMTQKFQIKEKDTRVRRRKELQDIIDKHFHLKHDEDAILVMTLNEGYNYIFLNWLCGLEAEKIAADIRESTLIVATDEESEQLAKKLGFQVVRGDWLKFKIEKKAAKSFALGAHRWAVALQIVYAFDLVHMGYNVIQQDADVVWLKDVRPYFWNTYADVEMACDGRLDNIGPGNSGFVHVRSNCKTRIYMETLVHYIGLVLRGRSDQRVWNMFLREYDFRQVVYELIPPHLFAGGYQWGNGRKKGDKLSKDTMMLHASWTSDHTEKITKFRMLFHWYFNESCPFYKPGLTGKHIDPHYYLPVKDRDWTFPDLQEKKWWV